MSGMPKKRLRVLISGNTLRLLQHLLERYLVIPNVFQNLALAQSKIKF